MRSTVSVSILGLLLASGSAMAQVSGIYDGRQRTGSGQSQTVVLKGTVVNAATGEPIARALVHVMNKSVMSALDGTFSLPIETVIAPNQRNMIGITAQKPGYFNEFDINPGRSFPRAGPTVAIGPDMEPVTVKLWPQAVITGHVSDAAGEPIELASVTLTAVRVEDGRRVLRQEAGRQVDEEGNFRIPNLRPGTYYVALTPRNDSLASIAGQSREGHPALIYYPAADSVAAATPLTITAGQKQTVDFSVKDVPLFHVSGRVAGMPPGQFLNMNLFAPEGQVLQVPIRTNPVTGTFEIPSIAPGQYRLRAFSGGREGQQLSAEVDLPVAANVSDMRVLLTPEITIPVQVRLESNSGKTQTAPFVQARLVPTDPLAQRQFYVTEHSTNGERSYSIDNVSPGTYWVEAPTYGPQYVLSMVSGTTNLLTEPLVVSPGAPARPIEVVLRDDAATLHTRVQPLDADTSPFRAWVLIFPSNGNHRPVRPAFPVSGTDQALPGLAPGDYDLYAFDEITDLEYNNADAMQGFSSKAAHVSLSPKMDSRVTLEVIRRSE